MNVKTKGVTVDRYVQNNLATILLNFLYSCPRHERGGHPGATVLARIVSIRGQMMKKGMTHQHVIAQGTMSAEHATQLTTENGPNEITKHFVVCVCLHLAILASCLTPPIQVAGITNFIRQVAGPANSLEHGTKTQEEYYTASTN